MVFPEFHSNVMHRSWARVTWTPFLPQIVLLFRCPVSQWSHSYSLSWAFVWNQVMLYELLSFTLVREHRFLGFKTSIWSRLTVSKAVNYHFLHEARICPGANLRIQDVGCHELLAALLDTTWWSFLSFIQMWCIDPEHVSLEDPVCHK